MRGAQAREAGCPSRATKCMLGSLPGWVPAVRFCGLLMGRRMELSLRTDASRVAMCTGCLV